MEAKSSNIEERNRALLTWYPMVQRIAQRAAASYGLPTGVDASDLVSCGVLGLAEAWERFDAERGVAFEAYAVPRVRGAIIDAIRAGDWVPRKARQKSRETGGPLMVLISTDAQRADAGERSAAELVADDLELTPGEELMTTETRRELMVALNNLPEREQMIVSLRYFHGAQLADIARKLGVTESRVSQLHTRALRMLRDALASFETQPSPSAA